MAKRPTSWRGGEAAPKHLLYLCVSVIRDPSLGVALRIQLSCRAAVGRAFGWHDVSLHFFRPRRSGKLCAR